MKILSAKYVVIPFLLAIPWYALAGNNQAIENGQVPGQPFASLQQQIDALQQQVADLQALLAAVSVAENGDLIITGINVHIRNSLGQTPCSQPFTPYECNGKGNLIIGYDEDVNGDMRTGSHNLVVGAGHTYTSYSGIVNGRDSEISGPGSAVIGGLRNVANGRYATITGGWQNTASGRFSSVSGGEDNIASGDWSTVSGGEYNNSSGAAASVSGGYFNLANGNYSSVSGGNSNMAAGENSTVGGGLNRSTGFGDFDAWTAGSLFEPN